MTTKKGNNTFIKKIASHQKKWYAKWHTWVGFFSGSVLLLVTLTGSLLVYEAELDAFFNEEVFTFEKSDKKLSFQEIYDVTYDQIPEGKITNLTRFKDKNDAVVVFYKDLIKSKDSPVKQAIVDPYTGVVTKKRVYGDTIMGFIRHFHRTLLIPTIGKYVVGIASLMMVFLIITGLRLWIPRQWKNVKSRLKIKLGASFKRTNYDLHNVLGFYFSPMIMLIAITGVMITFSRFVVVAVFIGGLTMPQSLDKILGKKSKYILDTEQLSIDNIIEKAKVDMPRGVIRSISLPRDSVGIYSLSIITPTSVSTGDKTTIQYDQYSGERLLSSHHDFAHFGKMYLNWVTPIHYGTFGGTITRIMALIASLVGSSMIVTGFIIWFGRWKKRKHVNI